MIVLLPVLPYEAIPEETGSIFIFYNFSPGLRGKTGDIVDMDVVPCVNVISGSSDPMAELDHVISLGDVPEGDFVTGRYGRVCLNTGTLGSKDDFRGIPGIQGIDAHGDVVIWMDGDGQVHVRRCRSG